MIPSPACIEFVKSFEGFQANAYKCPAGVWTIGYGTTEYVQPGDTVTEAEAERLLYNELLSCSDAVCDLVDVDLEQHQFDALCSFIYNVGRSAFSGSTLLKLINAGNFSAAAAQFQRWNKGGGKVLAGLSRRREAEREMFNGDVAA
jgi:lysozyme